MFGPFGAPEDAPVLWFCQVSFAIRRTPSAFGTKKPLALRAGAPVGTVDTFFSS